MKFILIATVLATLANGIKMTANVESGVAAAAEATAAVTAGRRNRGFQCGHPGRKGIINRLRNRNRDGKPEHGEPPFTPPAPTAPVPCVPAPAVEVFDECPSLDDVNDVVCPPVVTDDAPAAEES